MVPERDPRLIQIEDMVRRLLRRNADAHLANALEKMHDAEVAQILAHLVPEERLQAFGVVAGTKRRALVLSECDEHIVRELLEASSDEEIIAMLKELDSDDARYVLEALPEERAEAIVQLMDAQQTSAVQDFMAYAPESAGAIMTDSYVAIHEDVTVEEAVGQVRKASEVDNVFYVYVVDENGVLRGVVSLRLLLLSDPSKRLAEIMTRNVWSVNVHADQEHVARLVSRYNILAIPVVGDDGILMGIVTVDDVLDILREEATEDILKMAGTHSGEEITSLSALRLAWVRLPWLLISWMGSLVAAYFISQFTHELSRAIALAAFIPVINGTAGNVGSQSVAIMVRGLATGKVSPKAWLRVVGRQVLVGLILGACFGLLLSGLASWHFPSIARLGLIVGLAIFAAMTISATMASLIPLVLSYLRLDPALMTGPFVTTTVDLMSVFIYFNVARLFFSMA